MAGSQSIRYVLKAPARSNFMFLNELTRSKNEDGEYKGDPNCGTGILFDKKKNKVDIKNLTDIVKKLAKERFGEKINIKSKKFSNPLRDGDQELEDGEKEGEQYKNCMFINSVKKYKTFPGLQDNHKEDIDRDDPRWEQLLVSGYYFYFSLILKAFETKNEAGSVINRGVSVKLGNIMFVKEGPRLDGGKSAEEDFADIDAADEDIEEDDNSVDLTPKIVKETYELFVEENGAKEGKELLKEYGIKNVSKLKTLDEDDLEALYDELKDGIED